MNVYSISTNMQQLSKKVKEKVIGAMYIPEEELRTLGALLAAGGILSTMIALGGFNLYQYYTTQEDFLVEKAAYKIIDDRNEMPLVQYEDLSPELFDNMVQFSRQENSDIQKKTIWGLAKMTRDEEVLDRLIATKDDMALLGASANQYLSTEKLTQLYEIARKQFHSKDMLGKFEANLAAHRNLGLELGEEIYNQTEEPTALINLSINENFKVDIVSQMASIKVVSMIMKQPHQKLYTSEVAIEVEKDQFDEPHFKLQKR